MDLGMQVSLALALDTPLPTPSGWTTMGDVKVGDTLFDEQGKQCKVTLTTETRYDRPCYRVLFSDGSEIVADADHKWYVESDTPFDKPNTYSCKRFPQAGVINTEQMAKTFKYGKPNKYGKQQNRYAIPATKALDLPDVDLPVDPYVLGIWLGDGSLCSTQYTMQEADAVIVSREFELVGYVCEERTRITGQSDDTITTHIRLASDNKSICSRGHNKNTAGTIQMGQTAYCAECHRQNCKFNRHNALGIAVSRDAPRPRDTLSKRLTDLNLLGHQKTIPPPYLRASQKQRMALLQGLMDTDGHITMKGRAGFTNTSRSLIEGFVELVTSLGFKPTISHRSGKTITSFNPKYPDRTYQGTEQWVVSFLAYNDKPIARLPRKFERQKEPERASETRRRRIVGVESVPSVPVRCLQVDSPNHLFLAGRSMIPTHNTETFNIVAADMVADGLPTIGSDDIYWMSRLFHSNPNDLDNMVHKIGRARLLGRLGVWLNGRGLVRTNRQAVRVWMKGLAITHIK